ncbi:phosphopyruvate hydratase [Mediterraneibacter sp. gm002]|uniref:phosphopyruvate hydratase n=1 Tax=Mediterraneibacter sp. gm002 TaxID=2527876 RepID=UPI0026D4AE26
MLLDKLQKFCVISLTQGGVHADNTLDIQEFMIVPVGADDFSEGLRMCAEIYQELKALLKKQGLSTAVGDEGGFAPDLPDSKTALQYLKQAVQLAGYRMGKDIRIALDIAASELYNSDFKTYEFPGESKMCGKKVIRSAEELIDYYEELMQEFPICSIEDPLDEEDWEGWELLTVRLGRDVQLVGDDLFVTNVERLRKGIEKSVANAILIKVNQIGTLTEAIEAIETAQKSGYRAIISHRSGETEDTTIADLAVAFNTGQIKTGAPCRSERVAKYNRLLRIQEEVEN